MGEPKKRFSQKKERSDSREDREGRKATNDRQTTDQPFPIRLCFLSGLLGEYFDRKTLSAQVMSPVSTKGVI